MDMTGCSFLVGLADRPRPRRSRPGGSSDLFRLNKTCRVSYTEGVVRTMGLTGLGGLLGYCTLETSGLLGLFSCRTPKPIKLPEPPSFGVPPIVGNSEASSARPGTAGGDLRRQP